VAVAAAAARVLAAIFLKYFICGISAGKDAVECSNRIVAFVVDVYSHAVVGWTAAIHHALHESSGMNGHF